MVHNMKPVYADPDTNAFPAGSDLAGETSAALSAVSIVFAGVDSNFSAECLSHAKQLFKFGTQCRGLYHDAIKGAEEYYEYYETRDHTMIATT